MNEIRNNSMKEYKIIFESGVSETITVGDIEINEHIGRIDIRDEEGNELDDYYMDLEDISAIIPK